MKKIFFYISMFAMALTGCTDNLSAIDNAGGKTDVTIPADAEAGELIIKFSPEMSDILDRAQMSKTRGAPPHVRAFPLPMRCSTFWAATASSECSLLTPRTRRVHARLDSTCGTQSSLTREPT